MTVKKPDPMLSVADVAKMLGVSNMTIYRLVHTDVIPGYRVGRSIRIDGRDLTRFMRNANVSALLDDDPDDGAA